MSNECEEWKRRALEAETRANAEAEVRLRTLHRAEQVERELAALRASVVAEPSGAERIHVALVKAGVPEEDEVSGVLGLEEHVTRALTVLKRAEADNAALLRRLRVEHGVTCQGPCDICNPQERHPGAPLLAELEALRRVREALGSYPLDPVVTDLHYAGPELLALRRACINADALKVKP